VASQLWDTAARYPDKPAVSIDGTGQTFAELRDAAAVVAGWLGERMQVGDRILLVAATSGAWVQVYLGALTAGAAVVLANPSSSKHELANLARDSGAVLVVADEDTADRCADLDAPVVSLAKHPWASSPAVNGPPASLTGTSLALLAYTSGTTGRPKGVPLTHAQLLASIDAALFSWDWSADDVVVHALPLYHQHGLGALHAALCTGSSAAMLSHFDAGYLAATARAAKATVLFAVPAIYRRLVDVLDTLPATDSAALRSLRLRICGSAPLDDDLAANIADRLGAPALVRYGMTESGLDVSQPLGGAEQPPSESRCRASSCGWCATRLRSASGWRARSSCAARRCSTATGATPTPPRRRSPPTAGYAPGTWRYWMRPMPSCGSVGAARS
jgi:acyl-CoA synthetase (AMP-forming)/AMP-acid ligase II